ncbi:MAG: hypothetical protein PUC21_00440 [Bacteroidales bacterium]|nr:hypothetical protein [Bacteroidales bacterium]
MTAKNETPRRERQRAIPSAQSAQSSPIASLTLATCTPRCFAAPARLRKPQRGVPVHNDPALKKLSGDQCNIV